LAQLYRGKVENLKSALDDPQCRTEAAETLRGLIERVSVRPTDENGFEIDLTGEIVRMIDLANATSRHKKTAPTGAVLDLYKSSVKVVAGTGFEPVTFRL
jgi:site-specific DNA recombinase